MAKYILSNIMKTGENNAGSKAGNDVIEIAKRCGYEMVPLYVSTGTKTKIHNIIAGVNSARHFVHRLEEGDIVILQYPMNRLLMKQLYKILRGGPNISIVTLIHDIDYLRDVPLRNKGVEEMKQLELSLLGSSDYLICHNEKMIQELKKEEIHVNYISLHLFDYLYDGKPATVSNDRYEIIVAGNLLESKAGYLYGLNDSRHQFQLSLYGSYFNKEHFLYSRASYHGSYPPEKLIENIHGAYGLVWDGPSTKCCEGSHGKYLRINNPHKVSLYIAAGLPVIIWKEAALCSFVEENGIGFGVDSLDELDRELESHEEDYDIYQNNLHKLREKVCEGGFLMRALAAFE